MIRFLPIYAWLRWRVLVNGMKSGWRRDAFEGVSRAAGLAMALFLGALLAGGVVVVGYLSWGGGRAIATGGAPAEFSVFLLRTCILAVFGILVILVPIGQSQAAPGVRAGSMRLLPIPRGLLHAAEVFSWLFNPFLVLLAALAICLPWGLADEARRAAAAGSLLAGLALLCVAAAFGSLLSQACQWMLRDRGRAEWMAMGLLVLILLLSLMAPFLGNVGREGGEEAVRPDSGMLMDLPSWLILFPSDLYVRSVLSFTEGLPGRALLFIAGLILQALLLFGLSSAVHRTLLESPAGGRVRRINGGASRWPETLPGIPDRVAAVAIVLARTMLRTVRGKLAVYFSGPFLFAMVLVLRALPEERALSRILLHAGPTLFGAGVLFVLLSLQPILLNQFAVDGRGVALQFLSPLSSRDLLHGKALGGGILFAIGAALCLPAAVALFPATNPWLWVAVLAGAPSTYLLAAPAFAFLSVSFPKRSDLGRIGPASEAHGMARFLGLLLTAAASLPASLFVTVFGTVMGREAVAAFFCIAWTALCAPVSLMLLNALQSLAEDRRENILMVAGEG